MSSDEKDTPVTKASRLWSIAKGVGMVLAMLGGGYGSVMVDGAADEGVVRDVLMNTLDEMEELRSDLRELRRLRDEDRRQWSTFLMTHHDVSAAQEDGEGEIDGVEGAFPDVPDVSPAAMPAAEHVKKARQLLDDL